MAQVPDRILTWLYRVLHEYQDPQRTYSDAARTLSAFPSLTPRTEVYHYDTGSSALLLTLSNTIPVNFRGTTYRFPIKLWLPHSYPREPPTVYVTPSAEMLIRPGQHVGVDGRVYHPYLAEWGKRWERASVAEFLEYLQQAFAKEPPVISRQQQMLFQQRGQQQQAGGASPAPPQLPPKQSVESASQQQTPTEMSSVASPPPRPPKPGEEPAAGYPVRTSSRQISRDGPPLPPLPHERHRDEVYASPAPYQNGYGDPGRSQMPPNQQQYRSGRSSGPPLPPLPGQQGTQQQHSYAQQSFPQQQRPPYERSPVSPVSPINGYSELPETKYSHHPPIPYQQAPHQYQQYPSQDPTNQQQYQHQPVPQPQQRAYHQAPPPPHQQPQPYPPTQQPMPQQFPQPTQYPQQPPLHQQPKQPPPDLLSSPFDIALPSPTAHAPAPPIPPNPEKEHLLHALSARLTHHATTRISQTLAALTPLKAQHHALLSARATLDHELRQLDHLNATLASNESILRDSIKDCDRTIRAAREKPPPPIDDVLIAPTVVANQLWRLCAEEAACKEAMYVLQRAVDRGRVGGEAFVRQMRGLGRECFLKMVLARKCARGLGLEV